MKTFSKREVVDVVLEILQELDETDIVDISDVHQEGFNSDYYIIGTFEAKEALERYGTLKAIQEISDYEGIDFNLSFLDFSDPEKLASILWFLKGDEYLQQSGIDRKTASEALDIVEEDYYNLYK